MHSEFIIAPRREAIQKLHQAFSNKLFSVLYVNFAYQQVDSKPDML